MSFTPCGTQGIGWRCYSLRLALPALLGLAIDGAVFYRSPEFFDGIRLVSTWYFLQPRDAVQAVELMLGLSIWNRLGIAVTALFPAYAAYTAWTAWNEPTTERLLQAALAVMSAMLFTAVSHLWPWYVIWALALAVLLPSWWLSRFIVGVAVVSPFTPGILVGRAVRAPSRSGGARHVRRSLRVDGFHAVRIGRYRGCSRGPVLAER